MADDDTEFEEGVDFSEIDPILDDLSYPITADELVERHGDVELERTNADPISIEELFDYMGDDTFESEEQVRQMILGQMPRDSVGRAGYSDRGGSQPEATEAAEDAGEGTDADVEDGASTDPDTKQQERD
jgi:hypothetical protein